MVDLSLLKEKIAISGIKLGTLAEACGVHRATLYNKLRGKSDFSSTQIVALSSMLRLTNAECNRIFLSE